jgi:O-antigen/teichoic acid export membrane protein
MSTSAKLASSFGAQATMALVGIASVPVYLSLMGPEGYGLVGFHVTLQTWMLLVDMGLPTAMGRRLSVWLANRDAQVASFVKAVERIFWCLALLAALGIAAASPWIARHWLGRSELESAHMIWSLRLMACMIAFRWVASIYQAALVGLECQNFVNGVVVTSALSRTGAAVLGLLALGGEPQAYFVAHLAGSLVEVVVLRKALVRQIPLAGIAPSNLRLLFADMKLAGGFALITAVWLAMNQVDKVLLSHILPLKDFGLFSIVTAICAGIATLVPAFTQAIQPRLTTLLAQHKRGEFIHLYRLSVALLLMLSASVAGTVASHPAAAIYAWTGNHEAAHQWAEVLGIYAAGTGLANMLLAPFLLQCASGDIRVHVRSYLIVGIVWVPGLVWSTYAFGPWGAGLAWCAGNLVLLSICWWLVHRRLLSGPERQGMHLSLLLQGVLLGAAIALLSALMPTLTSRAAVLAGLVFVGGTLLLVGFLGSNDLRRGFLSWHGRRPLHG